MSVKYQSLLLCMIPVRNACYLGMQSLSSMLFSLSLSLSFSLFLDF